MPKLEAFFFDYLMQLVPIMGKMQLRGVAIDQVKRAELRERAAAERALAVERLATAFPNRKIMGEKTISSQALMKLLYEDMHLPKQFHPKTKRPTANAEALKKLESRVTDTIRPHFTDILTVRDLGVLISTFLDAELDRDGRYRWSTNLAGTVSGRISTSDSPFWTGGNVQNWPEEIRCIAVADPGCGFIYSDGEQAEARVVAWLAQERGLMRIYDSGLNSHIQIGHLLFHEPVPQPSEEAAFKKKPIYARTKKLSHASHYGEGKRRAALQLGCTEKEAEGYLRLYHNAFPNIRSNFQGDIERSLGHSRTLTTPFGRRRQFFGRWNDDLLRQAYAYAGSAPVADWLDIGLLRLARFTHGLFDPPSPDSIIAPYLTIRQSDLKFVSKLDDLRMPSLLPAINVHDGLLCQAPLARLSQAVDIVREALTYAIPFPAGPLTIPVSISIGTNWGEVEKATPERLALLMKVAA